MWTPLENHALSSVAWSPQGNYIAFVAAGYNDDSDDGLLRASIWMMSALEPDKTPKLTRLDVLGRKEGIPIGLFWLDDSRLGWAAAGDEHYTLMQMALPGGKPQRLTSQNFTGTQGDAGPASAPEDVYWDAGSRTILLCGELAPSGSYVRIVPLATKKVRSLGVPHPEGLTDPQGWVSAVTLCGSLRDPDKPVFYLSASVTTGPDVASFLWRSDSYSLHQDKVLNAAGSFPRTSPDGRVLALTRDAKIALYNPQSGTQRTLATFSPTWADLPPAIGCPFSWSPDGKRIAYADGSRIKIISVDAGSGK